MQVRKRSYRMVISSQHAIACAKNWVYRFTFFIIGLSNYAFLYYCENKWNYGNVLQISIPFWTIAGRNYVHHVFHVPYPGKLFIWEKHRTLSESLQFRHPVTDSFVQFLKFCVPLLSELYIVTQMSTKPSKFRQDATKGFKISCAV
jgi:hypothetical protein